MRKNLLWLKTAVLAVCCSVLMLTSCGDDNIVNGSSDEGKVFEELLGSWSADADGIADLDLATFDMKFGKGDSLLLSVNTYYEEADDYISVNMPATYRLVGTKDIEGRVAQSVEISYDKDWLKEQVGEDNELFMDKDTIYCILDGDKLLFRYGADEESDGYADIEFTKGATDVATLDKAKVKEIVALLRQYYEEYINDSTVADVDVSYAKAPRKVKSSVSGRDLANWMKDVPDDWKVCQLMIPGTHDAATYAMPYVWMLSLGKTQLCDWRGQFNSGIRAFDMRTRQSGGTTGMYHSMLDCNLSFGAALDDIADILRRNPGEGIILLVKGEGNDMHLNMDEYWRDQLQNLFNVFPACLDTGQLDMALTIQRDLEQIYEKLGKEGLLAKYSPDMTMKDLRGKALIWLVNQPDSWDFNNTAYANLRDYIALEKDGRIYALDGSSVPLTSQNDFECPSDKTVSEFAKQKAEKFDNILRSTIVDNESLYWCYNAANAYVQNLFPDYIAFANQGYPLFISSLKNYHRGRGIVLQDFAGQSDIKYLNTSQFMSVCVVPALVTVAANGAVDIVKSFLNFIAKVVTGKHVFNKDDGHFANALIWAAYNIGLNRTTSKDTYAQQLTEAIVENNFLPVEAAITAIDGTNTTKAEGYANLFDGNSKTKWCVNSSNRVVTHPSLKSIWFVDFKTAFACTAKSYTLITGDDTGSYPTRNPKKWRLLGQVDGNWTVLSEVDTENGGESLPASNYSQKEYTISNPKNCQRYRLEVESCGETPSGNNKVVWMQLGGFKLFF